MQNCLSYKEANDAVDVAFITVNFNTKQLLAALLTFFESSQVPFSYSIIVVDNNSADGSAELVTDKKGITVIRNSENIGYGRAVNKGMAFANSKYICVLNTDVILNEEALTTLWRFMEDNPSVGVCSPIVCYPDGRIQGFFFKFTLFLLYSDFIKKAYSKIKKFAIAMSGSPVRVDGITGAFIFLRKSLFKDKLFDEDFFYEDTDLAHRLKDRDIITVIIPLCRIIHLGGQSSNIKNWKLFYKSKYLYIKKHYGQAHSRNIHRIDFLKATLKAYIYKVLTLVCPTERVKSKFNYYLGLYKSLNEL